MWLRISRTQLKMFQNCWINWTLLEEGQFPLLAFLVTAKEHPAWVSTNPYHQDSCGRRVLRMACLLNYASEVIDILMSSSSCGISASVCHWMVTMTITTNTLTHSASIITVLSLISCKLIREMPVSLPYMKYMLSPIQRWGNRSREVRKFPESTQLVSIRSELCEFKAISFY